jgi:type II secretion system protein N
MNRKNTFYLIGYTSLFILFTSLFTLLNYPSDRLTAQINGWILPASKGSLTVENADIRLPFSIKMDGVTLKLDQGTVGLGEVSVKPHLLGLLSGKRGADIRLENPWLESRMAIDSSGKGFKIDVPSLQIDLSTLPESIMSLPLDLNGRIGGSLDLRSENPSQGITSGELQITSGPVEISGDLLKALGFDSLDITGVTALATVKENVLTLRENSIKGDIMATARGYLKINPGNFMASRCDIIVVIKPDDKLRERLLPILSMIDAHPKADGTVDVRIRGTIAKPSFTM